MGNKKELKASQKSVVLKISPSPGLRFEPALLVHRLASPPGPKIPNPNCNHHDHAPPPLLPTTTTTTTYNQLPTNQQRTHSIRKRYRIPPTTLTYKNSLHNHNGQRRRSPI